MKPIQLLEQLIREGGAIVSSNDCGRLELSDAQAHGRFAVDVDGMGFVRRPKEWLDRVHKADGYDPSK